MKKHLFLTIIMMVIFLFVGVSDQAQAAEPAVTENPKCGMGHLVPDPFENHVTLSATWEDGSPQGEYPFDFGDGGPTMVLTGTQGSKLFDHDYPIVIGQSVTYYLGFDVYNDVSPLVAHCWDSVTIDYRLPPTYKTYLPLVFKPAPESSCSIDVSEYDKNHFVFNVTWQDAGIGAHQFLFGDGTETEQFSGSNGNGTTWHDYPYPGGQFIVTMNLSGGGSCSTQINVYWP